jgi:uncharacterized membrane protein required for colicin V production
MGTMDIFLLIVIVSTLIVGFFWGAARSLMLLAAWLIAFLAGAYLKLEQGSYLASQWDNYVATINEMAAFGLIYQVVLVAAIVIIFVITRGNQRVTKYQVLDDVVGALFAVFVAVLSIGGIIIVLATFYGPDPGPVVDWSGGPEWTASLYQSLLSSNIGGGINEHLVPLIGAVLGPILPPDVREVFG